MHRSGIAIMVSLMFVSLALLFSATFFIFLNSMLNSQKKEYGLIQKNLLYLDSLQMLKSSKELLNNSFLPKDYIAKFDGLELSSKDTKIDIHLSSAQSKINFNQYREANITDLQFDKFLKSLLSRYGVTKPEYFFELLNSKSDEPDYSNDSFYGFAHFSKLLELYCAATGDLSVKNIPWNELFVFVPKEMGGFVDCEMISPVLKEELSRQYGPKSISCDATGGFQVKKADVSGSYQILVEMAFETNGASEKLKYYFDMKTENVYVIE